MKTYKLSDYLHYDRNEPGAPQAVYFNTRPDFAGRLALILDVVNAQLDEEDEQDIGVGLNRIRDAIEKEFGAMSLGEVCCVTHYIALSIGMRTGMEVGFHKGVDAVNEAYSGPIKATQKGKAKPVATA